MVGAAKEVRRTDGRPAQRHRRRHSRMQRCPGGQGTMGYGHQTMEPDDAERAAGSPGVVLKIIPHLVRFGYGDVVVKEAYTGRGTLDLYPHALAPLAELPVREIVSVTHTVSDMTLLAGEVVHDYLA